LEAVEVDYHQTCHLVEVVVDMNSHNQAVAEVVVEMINQRACLVEVDQVEAQEVVVLSCHTDIGMVD